MAAATKTYILDSSFALARLLPDEKPPVQVEEKFQLFAEGKLAFACPILLKYEIANALKSCVIQKRADPVTAKQILKKFLALEINYLEVDYHKVLVLAIKQNHSVYDAAYLYLARSLKRPLLTLDSRLKI